MCTWVQHGGGGVYEMLEDEAWKYGGLWLHEGAAWSGCAIAGRCSHTTDVVVVVA